MGMMESLQALFSSKGARQLEKVNQDGCIAPELFYKYLDSQRALILFYSLETETWVGANRPFFDTFGFRDILEFRHLFPRISDFFADESFEIFADNDGVWLQQLEQGQQKEPTVRIRMPKGRRALFALRARQVKKGGDGLIFLEMTDVTDLLAARREREEAENAKKVFLGNISHEFRTPMNGILGFIDLLKNSHPSSMQQEYIHLIDRSARHMMTTIESLLDLAQMQSGRMQLTKSEFRPVRAFEELANYYHAEAAQKGIHFSIMIDPMLPTYLNADQRKVRQVLSHLLDNAIKFTDTGGKVYAEVHHIEHDAVNRYTIAFSVKDTGCGIDSESLKTITQPFVSGSHPDNRLGVGLTLSAGLLELMESSMQITSEVGVGSQFSFVLTLDGTTVASFDPIKGHKATVWLGDDALMGEANLLSRYLRSFGVEVNKVHFTEALDCNDSDLLYVVAPRENSSWVMEIGAIATRCRVVLLAEADETIPERARQVVDNTLKMPLLPTRISKHLAQIFRLPSKQSGFEKSPNTQKFNALIVEDNIINQRLIRLLLEEYNFAVTTADNGVQAVELCRKYPYDIIFMDIDMPVKDGIIATRDIRRLASFKRAPAPIVALTALAMQGDRERILSEGLDDYISKPLEREDIERILEKHLHILPSSGGTGSV